MDDVKLYQLYGYGVEDKAKRVWLDSNETRKRETVQQLIKDGDINTHAVGISNHKRYNLNNSKLA